MGLLIKLRGIRRILCLATAAVSTVVLILAPLAAGAAVEDEIAAREKQIQELQRQVEVFQQEIDSSRTKSLTLQNEISRLNAQINQIQLEIKSLGLSINQTTYEIGDTQDKIITAEDKLETHRAALAQYLKITYDNDQKNLTTVILKNQNLSDFFNELNSVKVTQDNIKRTIDDIKNLKIELQDKKDTLEGKKTELEQLKRLQEMEKGSLDSNKNTKNKILKETKGQESKFQELVKKSQKDIETLRSQITYLQQNGVSVEDAIKYGQLAAIAAGIRPAFLIAELEVESRLGINVGKCNRAGDPPSKSYKAVMKPERDIQPFLIITAALGLDPDTTPVSCPQSGVVGWGGAMGPAQFLPSTWMGYKDAVAQITGHSPANPWNIYDAFTAAATKLGRGGATSKTRASEVVASKAYYSGKSTCSSAACNSYANAVQNKAAEIEPNL